MSVPTLTLQAGGEGAPTMYLSGRCLGTRGGGVEAPCTVAKCKEGRALLSFFLKIPTWALRNQTLPGQELRGPTQEACPVPAGPGPCGEVKALEGLQKSLWLACRVSHLSTRTCQERVL